MKCALIGFGAKVVGARHNLQGILSSHRIRKVEKPNAPGSQALVQTLRCTIRSP